MLQCGTSTNFDKFYLFKLDKTPHNECLWLSLLNVTNCQFPHQKATPLNSILDSLSIQLRSMIRVLSLLIELLLVAKSGKRTDLHIDSPATSNIEIIIVVARFAGTGETKYAGSFLLVSKSNGLVFDYELKLAGGQYQCKSINAASLMPSKASFDDSVQLSFADSSLNHYASDFVHSLAA